MGYGVGVGVEVVLLCVFEGWGSLWSLNERRRREVDVVESRVPLSSCSLDTLGSGRDLGSRGRLM